MQFLVAGIVDGDEGGVFVTFEERPAAIRRNFRSFGWDIPSWEEAGKWTFVDASPQPGDETIVAGEFDLSSLVVRVKHAVDRVRRARASRSTRPARSSTSSTNVMAARRALFQVAHELSEMGVTSVMTAERAEDYGPISRYGFEEFVADNVIVLRNALEGEKRRRTLEVLKLRGGSHQKGEQLFTIQPAARADRRAAGVARTSTTSVVRHAPDHRHRRARHDVQRRLLRQARSILVTGPTGTGKSLLSTHFVAGGTHRGRARVAAVVRGEPRASSCATPRAGGYDFEQMEADGKLRIVAASPESASLEDHLLQHEGGDQRVRAGAGRHRQPHRAAARRRRRRASASTCSG